MAIFMEVTCFHKLSRRGVSGTVLSRISSGQMKLVLSFSTPRIRRQVGGPLLGAKKGTSTLDEKQVCWLRKHSPTPTADGFQPAHPSINNDSRLFSTCVLQGSSFPEHTKEQHCFSLASVVMLAVYHLGMSGQDSLGGPTNLESQDLTLYIP